MAIVEMKRIDLLAMRQDQRKLLRTLQDMGCVEITPLQDRSEERRVGKECRSRWSPYH